MKKYKLTKERKTFSIDCNKTTVYRIEDLNGKGVKAGEKDLSHDGNCWIYNDACIFENSEIGRKARVYENAQVSGNTWFYENAKVYGNLEIYVTPDCFNDIV